MTLGHVRSVKVPSILWDFPELSHSVAIMRAHILDCATWTQFLFTPMRPSQHW